MIKLMIHFTKIMIALIVALLLNSCKKDFEISINNDSIKGSRNVKTENRNIDNFTKILVKNAIDCEVYQDKNFRVEVIADDNIIHKIKTEKENNTLVISCEEGNFSNLKSKLVRVYMPIVETLEATSASDIDAKTKIKGNNILVKASSAADISAEIESENISLEASSGSDIKVSGKAINLSTHSSSGSDINAENLLANTVNAESSSGSSTTVHPIIKLKAHASSASDIEYVNNPKTIEATETSAGDVSSN